MSTFLRIAKECAADAGMPPEMAAKYLSMLELRLADKGGKGPNLDAQSVHEAAAKLLDMSAPKHLWKWRTAGEVAVLLGFEPSRSNCIYAAQALDKLGVVEKRTTHGRLVRLVPPIGAIEDDF